MIRLATGDLSAVLPGRSPCGRTNTRIKGWMGRADQTTKVKGMFVRPGADRRDRQASPGTRPRAARRHARGEQDAMTLQAESAGGAPVSPSAVAATLQAVTKLKGEVKLVAPGSLPNDGKVIADERPVSCTLSPFGERVRARASELAQDGPPPDSLCSVDTPPKRERWKSACA